MRKVVIGHRGVGKTAFLARHKKYCEEKKIEVLHFDLDAVIEKRSGLSINDIFETKGEKVFREMEDATFTEIIKENKNFVISLGAGFPSDKIPSDINILFISRVTDSAGRIFLNRPRLNSKIPALEEYQDRFLLRQSQFIKYSNEIYHMPEGISEGNPVEEKIALKDFLISDAFYTLLPHEIKNIENLKENFKKIELRTDLLSNESIESLVTADKKFQWLVSIRNANRPQTTTVRLDYDCLLKSVLDVKAMPLDTIVSSHHENLQQGIEALAGFSKFHLKLSPQIENFSDLWTGHSWQQEDPKKRSFLPRSDDGRWLWYRELAKYSQSLNFVRNFTDLSDQPSPYQWLRLPKKRPAYFGAVLGKPIYFSRSPVYHQNFMAQQKSFFTAICLSESELQEFFPWLVKMGLRYSAVTAPLKKMAYELSNRRSEITEQFHAANTLVLGSEQIFSQNTDLIGFQTLIDTANLQPSDSIAVWGGGGTLSMMKSILPKAAFFSSRTATLRDHRLIEKDGFSPDVLIWSAPRSKDTKWPVSKWQPKLVVDLNYQENSMGLEYAQKINCRYLSGLSMFESQAEQQQHYWSQL